MSNKSLEKWAWVLLYGGLFGVVLGLFVQPADLPLGAALMVAGGVAAAAGVWMIWWRSRREN
jgi:hypothetical protein